MYENFKRVFLETMFFKLACTITQKLLDGSTFFFFN